MALPPHQIATLVPDEVSFLTGPVFPCEPADLPSFAGTAIEYSKDGSMIATWTNATVTVYDTSNMQKISEFEGDGLITFMCFSPKGTYITSYERPQKQLANAHRNLKVWDMKSGVPVVTFHKKGISKENWPAIHFTGDEKHLFHLITNAVNVHESSNNFEKAVRKVELKGVTAFAVSPGKRKVIACYTPEGKSQPACAQIMDWGEGGSSMINRKSFFRSQYCKFQWNDQGTNVLIRSSCDYDATNASYFGEAKLYYMSADGKTDMIVPLDKDGSVLDAQWAPDGKTFVAVYGTIPSVSTLYSDKCKPLCKMITGPYNTVRFSPQGRFILLAGFGQLPGDIQLFDRQDDDSCKAMGGCKSECSVVCEWAPCGRYFMTACTAPRMRIDNRVTVYTYFGERVFETPYTELLDAQWQPTQKDVFPDRGQSPERLKEVKVMQQKGVNITVAKKVAGYVPPHQRMLAGHDEAGPTVQGFDAVAAADRVRNMQNKTRSKACVGADDDLVAKAPNKNAKKRAAKNKKAAGEVSESLAAVDLEPAAAAAPEDPAKRLRNLRKKLQKIVLTKGKQDAGEALTPEQVLSIAGEMDVRQEMRELGADDV